MTQHQYTNSKVSDPIDQRSTANAGNSCNASEEASETRHAAQPNEELQERLRSLRMEANSLESALRQSAGEFEYVGRATVTVDIDVVGNVWADSEDAAEEAFSEALQDYYYYGLLAPEPSGHRDDVVGVEFQSERVDGVEVLWIDKEEAEEEWDDE